MANNVRGFGEVLAARLEGALPDMRRVLMAEGLPSAIDKHLPVPAIIISYGGTTPARMHNDGYFEGTQLWSVAIAVGKTDKKRAAKFGEYEAAVLTRLFVDWDPGLPHDKPELIELRPNYAGVDNFYSVILIRVVTTLGGI